MAILDVDLNDVAVFTTVVQAQGFTAAGRVLGLPASAVSRRVSRLEAQLGYRLLHRTTRQVGLTEPGRVFYERTASIPRLVDEASRAVARSRDTPSGTVRMTAPPDDGGVIWQLVGGFLRAHPDVDLEITHTLDRVDMLAEGVDVALRGGAAPDSTEFTAHPLFDSRILLVASPEYLALRGTPSRVEDLADHDGICMDPWVPNAIRKLDGDAAPVRLRMRNRVRSNSLQTAQEAALAGLGVAPLLELTCRDALRRGALVEVLRGALPPAAPMWAVAPLRSDRSAATAALLTWLVQAAERIATG